MSKNKNQNMLIVIAALVMVAIVVLPVMSVRTGDITVSGYDGIISEVVAAQYTPNQNYIDTTTISEGTTYLSIDMDYVDAWGVPDPTGLRTSVSGGVRILEEELINTANQPLDAGGYEVWAVKEVKASMGMSVRTIPQGSDPVTDVVFTYQLKENAFSVFSGADEQYAYIVAVSTIDVPKVQGGQMETSVMESGHNFAISPVALHEAPDWIVNAGYQGAISNYAIVNFDLTIIQAMPTIFWTRSEAEILYNIEVDVVCFGHWEKVQNPNLFGIQPDPNPFAWIAEFFSGIGNSLTSAGSSLVLIVIVIIVVVGVIIVVGLRSRRPKRGRPPKK